jgi:hypothetical protein
MVELVTESARRLVGIIDVPVLVQSSLVRLSS